MSAIALRGQGPGTHARRPADRRPSAAWGANKPSSVSAVAEGNHFSGTALAGRLVRPTRDSSGAGDSSSSMRPCSRWGLPCGPCCQRPGALLPHPFTLACAGPGRRGHRRSALCGTFRRLATPGRYPAPCPVELGLSSSRPDESGDRRFPLAPTSSIRHDARRVPMSRQGFRQAPRSRHPAKRGFTRSCWGTGRFTSTP
jgi:hypothetical protein